MPTHASFRDKIRIFSDHHRRLGRRTCRLNSCRARPVPRPKNSRSKASHRQPSVLYQYHLTAQNSKVVMENSLLRDFIPRIGLKGGLRVPLMQQVVMLANKSSLKKTFKNKLAGLPSPCFPPITMSVTPFLPRRPSAPFACLWLNKTTYKLESHSASACSLPFSSRPLAGPDPASTMSCRYTDTIQKNKGKRRMSRTLTVCQVPSWRSLDSSYCVFRSMHTRRRYNYFRNKSPTPFRNVRVRST